MIVVHHEFSAVGGDLRASTLAAGLIERTRSASVAIVIGVETISSLGEHINGMLQTASSVICDRTPTPDGIIELADTIPVWQYSQDLDAIGVRELRADDSSTSVECRRTLYGHCRLERPSSFARNGQPISQLLHPRSDPCVVHYYCLDALPSALN
jgi:hypothetical protein